MAEIIKLSLSIRVDGIWNQDLILAISHHALATNFLED